MKSTITKAVFPIAGLGTRFLPATKASAKEMLPVVVRIPANVTADSGPS